MLKYESHLDKRFCRHSNKSRLPSRGRGAGGEGDSLILGLKENYRQNLFTRACSNPAIHSPTFLTNSRRRLQHNSIRKPHHSITLLLKLVISLLVPRCLYLVSMPFTIQFHNELQRRAVKIHNGTAQRNLTAKLVTKQLAISEQAPSDSLPGCRNASVPERVRLGPDQRRVYRIA